MQRVIVRALDHHIGEVVVEAVEEDILLGGGAEAVNEVQHPAVVNRPHRAVDQLLRRGVLKRIDQKGGDGVEALLALLLVQNHVKNEEEAKVQGIGEILKRGGRIGIILTANQTLKTKVKLTKLLSKAFLNRRKLKSW